MSYAILQPRRWGIFPVFVHISELPGLLDEFAAGVLLARLISSRRGQAFLDWIQGRPWIVPSVAAVIVAFGLQVYWHNSSY
jgi:hypothetical protein